eukprot:CAMPEP_0116898188 /NCGR_PEP_ID=MMETSP0467-20121206/6952_1 /TAXON_ID=283647 /ORGANISM="Mesodinium pulex, Strain SPMC105" /LENGTH=95 /DNA_ID=CAMNT_0004570149 /DNA_START=55 /DNA_END=342 /DNA_ORIENTATION=-
MIANKAKNMIEDKNFEKNKESFNSAMNQSLELVSKLINRKDEKREAIEFMHDREKKKLRELLNSDNVEPIKFDKVDNNLNPFKSINDRYKHIVDT